MRLIHKNQTLLNANLISFSKVIKSVEFEKLINVMKENLKSMEENKIWDIVDFSKSAK